MNEEGIISAKKAGTAIITASATDGSGVTDSCEIIVEEVLVETIYLSYESVTIYKGETLSLYATIQPYNVSNKTLNWRSSNSEVASVDKDGTVIANKVGIAFIIVEATDGSGVKAICEVTVSPVAPISLILETANVTLDIGENVQLYTKIYPENTDDVTLKWTSSNSNVAKVDNNGKITAIAPGTAIITVSTTDGSNLSDSCSIQVKEQDVTKEKTYSITYVLNGGKNHSKNPATYTTSESIKLNTPTRKGYSFKGWYSDSEFQKKITKIEKGSIGDKTLYAKWEKTKYTITYKLNSGKNNAKNPKSYTITSKTITLKSPTRKGYTFKGWYSDAKFKKKVTKITKGSTGNKTLYAKWEKTKYTITYKLNGGKNSKKNPSKYTVTTSTIILKNPTRKGYTFKGWYSDAKFKKKVTKIKKGSTGNIKLYAKWVKKK